MGGVPEAGPGQESTGDVQEAPTGDSLDTLNLGSHFLHSLMAYFPDRIYFKDLQSRFLFGSRSWAEFNKLEDPSVMYGKTDFDFFTESHARAAFEDEQEIIRTGKAKVNVEEMETWPDGRITWCASTKVPLRDALGRIIGTFGISRDITERKLAEQQQRHLENELQQSQKMETLGKLASGIAHDMNNVLGAILGLASAHLEIQPEGSPTHHAFHTIAQAATRGGKVLKSLLGFARKYPVEERELDLNAMLREQVQLLARTTFSKVHLTLDLAPDLLAIHGDESSLTNAVMNICVNAVEAMPDSGALTIRTRTLDPHWVEVQLQDTGIGMSSEVLERALDPFFTTKEVGKGTGLGLSLAYRTVKAHQGEMDIQSVPERGTCVTLRFPACHSGRQAAKVLGESRITPGKVDLNILLVDDDELIQIAMRGMLEALGHSVTFSRDGEQALGMLEPPPDVVILDMNMPGLGGAGTLLRLRTLHPSLPVILATGRVDQSVLDLVAAYSHVTLLPKPFDFGALRQAIGQAHRTAL